MLKKNTSNNKIIVILGPTSSGKSDVAIKLACKFSCEIISADSRQIYRGMDIGTGKITKAEQKMVKHYMIDIISPKTNFTAAQFKKKAEKIIVDIFKRNKIPIICGGTGFWIKSVVDNITYPEVKPDWKLRKKLEKKSLEKLLTLLQKMDPERAKTVDVKNKVRLIRAIEICKAIGSVPSVKKVEEKNKFKSLQIGISISKEELHKKIKVRLKKRFDAGMIAEVEKLHTKDKISWKKIESFGLGYKLIPQYLRGEIKNKEELLEKIYLAEKNYAKRQMTWFSAQGRSASGGQIKWLGDYKKIEEEVEKFLS